MLRVSQLTQRYAAREALAVDEGDVEFAGISLPRHAGQALRHIGVVFQQMSLDLDRTVQRNLQFHADLHGLPRETARGRIVEGAEALGLGALGSLGLLLSVYVRQLDNFAGTMNVVIFPMYFISTALYPLRKLQESGADWVHQLARLNPFTHAVEWMRFALHGKDPGVAPWVVPGCLLVFFAVACWGCDPPRGFGGLTPRGGGPA